MGVGVLGVLGVIRLEVLLVLDWEAPYNRVLMGTRDWPVG